MSYSIECMSEFAPGSASPDLVANTADANRFLRTALDGLSGDASVLICQSECIPEASMREALLAVQHAFDRNAVVCARGVCDIARARPAVDQMPQSSIVAAPYAFCVLLRVSDLASFGMLDESFDSLPVSLAEFSQRLGNYGFSTVVANRALVDVSNMSASDRAEAKDISTWRFALGEKYPSFRNADILCENAWIDDFLEFEESIGARRPRVLFEFSDMMPWYCGTSEYQVMLLDYFKKHYGEKYDICVRANAEAIRFHDLQQRCGSVYLLDDEVPLCDLGFVAAQPLTTDQQLFLNSHCLRIVYTMLDCILLRSSYLAEGCPYRADLVRSGLRYADGILSISDFSHDDYADFLQSDEALAKVPHRTVYISSNSSVLDMTEADVAQIPFDEYVLVAGNYLKHKALSDVFHAVRGSGRNYVFMGAGWPEGWDEDRPLPENVAFYLSGELSEGFVSALYEKASCVVFPSQYEGFGLPIVIAWKHSKKVIVFDNDLNRELNAHFADMAGNLLFVHSFKEIPTAVDEALAGGDFVGSFETDWEPSIVEAEAFVAQVLAAPIDWRRLDERQWHFRLMGEVKREGAHEIGFKRLVDDRYLAPHPFRKKIAHGALGAARRILHR